MEIKIEQSFFTILRSKYAIFVNGVETFSAKAKIFHLPMKPELCLYDLSKHKILTIIRASPLFFEYDFVYENEERIELRADNNAKFEYSFNFRNSHFTILGHKGRLFSIFKNQQQIAWFSKDRIGDYFTIVSNNNEDSVILTSIVLAYDFHFHEGNNLSLDFGNIGWNLKEFDKNWQPS